MITKSLGKKKTKKKKKTQQPNSSWSWGFEQEVNTLLGTYLLYLLHLDGGRGFNDLVQIQISRAQAHNLIFLGVFLLG
jgi:hypothetical protein